MNDRCIWTPCRKPLYTHSHPLALWHGMLQGWYLIGGLMIWLVTFSLVGLSPRRVWKKLQ